MTSSSVDNLGPPYAIQEVKCVSECCVLYMSACGMAAMNAVRPWRSKFVLALGGIVDGYSCL